MTSNYSKNAGKKDLAKTAECALPNFGHIKRYWDHANQTYAAKILPGEYYVTFQDEIIVTTLGSCISACIRDPMVGIGGMNHFMLPSKISDSNILVHPSASVQNRYGNHAMENLLSDIFKNGGDRNNLEVKIFGGGKIIAKMTDVGQRNIEFIEEYIKTEGMKLIAKDLGDVYPRKVIYHPLSGKVRVKKLNSIDDKTIITRETQYLNDLDANPIAGDIELFK